MKKWTVTLASNTRDLPRNTSGIYLLFCGKILDYVGQSDHVRERLLQEHHVYDPVRHRVVALIHVQPYDERLALERYFNQKYNPANSYIGSGKQDAGFDSRFLQLTADQRRGMWMGPEFSEFKLPENPEDDFQPYQLEISSERISLNRLDVPSVISLPPEELFG